MSEEKISVDKLTSAYIKLRDAIRELEYDHKTKLSVLKEQQEVITNKILDICEEQNADSIRTTSGTISRRVVSRYWTSDWESMYEFMAENEAMHLLEQRIHNGNMKQFLEANPDKCPKGLQADRRFTVSVRKPTGK